MDEAAQLQAFGDSNSDHDGWLGAHCVPLPSHHPCQVYRTPKPNRHVQSRSSVYHWKRDYLSPLASTQHLLFRLLGGVWFLLACFVLFFLSFFSPLLSSLSNAFEAISKSAMTFFSKTGPWLKSGLWDRIASWSFPRGWVSEFWARQLIGAQSNCFAIIDFSFTKLSCTLYVHISFLTLLHSVNSECHDELPWVIY